MTSRLRTENLRLSYGPLVVIPDLSLEIEEGAVTSLVGRNGCGKSTLLRCIGRLLDQRSGRVLLDGKEIATIPSRTLAQQLAILPQGPTAPEGMTVMDLVEHGRYPHRQFLGIKSDEDRQTVAWALDQTGMTDLAHRPLERLSGGQRQRAWIAMALAQDTRIILLDEPTTFLDVAYQLELMELLRRLNHEHGTTILMVLHDLNQAAAYSDRMVAVRGGDVYANGRPDEVLTQDMVRDVFGIESDVIADPRTGSPLCIPYALAPKVASLPPLLSPGREAL
ncbi:iron complex transport system ATP-binding protein [Kribbella aluminosa]|uniref:Iron complex transport system ATP-binding protein n=1 Tax=Kribbella aluminosa TaxID=416017 RepID=A0ABS4UK71_9ACTN|nr:ABC transporter ATP-binding protein [Kribbella aluminosa]MBP2352004.1 iron complex transport system ATP-binding protein [Kribbella aluminosa]